MKPSESKDSLKLSKVLGLLIGFTTLLKPCMGAFQTYANFTDKYSAVFNIYDDEQFGKDSYMKVTLLYDTPPLELEERGGMWLGIGFGKNTMLGSDLVIC